MTDKCCHKVVLLYCQMTNLYIYHFYLLCRMTRNVLFLIIAKLFNIYASIYWIFTFGNLLLISIFKVILKLHINKKEFLINLLFVFFCLLHLWFNDLIVLAILIFQVICLRDDLSMVVISCSPQIAAVATTTAHTQLFISLMGSFIDLRCESNGCQGDM